MPIRSPSEDHFVTTETLAVPDNTVPAAPSALLLPAILLAVFVIPMSISGSAIALPGIADDLGASPAGLQWVINGFNVAFAVFGLVWGVASDRLGYRSTYRIGLIIVLAA